MTCKSYSNSTIDGRPRSPHPLPLPLAPPTFPTNLSPPVAPPLQWPPFLPQGASFLPLLAPSRSTVLAGGPLQRSSLVRCQPGFVHTSEPSLLQGRGGLFGSPLQGDQGGHSEQEAGASSHQAQASGPTCSSDNFGGCSRWLADGEITCHSQERGSNSFLEEASAGRSPWALFQLLLREPPHPPLSLPSEVLPLPQGWPPLLQLSSPPP
jgi:hypothetical protein